MNIKNLVQTFLQDKINENNRKKLTNTSPSLFCSNCTGGVLYHWLGLQFRSPFINLFMEPDDFLFAMEHLDQFLSTEIIELHDSGLDYPVGLAYGNTKVHFMHYEDFDSAISKWNERKQRVDKNNMAVMLTNWKGQNYEVLERFDRLPFKNKVVFTNKPYPEIKSAFCLKGYTYGERNVYATQHINGKRYLDQFDYVGFINNMPDK